VPFYVVARGPLAIKFFAIIFDCVNCLSCCCCEVGLSHINSFFNLYLSRFNCILPSCDGIFKSCNSGFAACWGVLGEVFNGAAECFFDLCRVRQLRQFMRKKSWQKRLNFGTLRAMKSCRDSEQETHRQNHFRHPNILVSSAFVNWHTFKDTVGFFGGQFKKYIV